MTSYSALLQGVQHNSKGSISVPRYREIVRLHFSSGYAENESSPEGIFNAI